MALSTRSWPIAVALGVLAAPTAAWATDYHVATGPCSHGDPAGSDQNDGLSRDTAFATVQHCLDTMTGGDSCIIHAGTYVGDFNCCGNGDGSIEKVVGTAAAPARIVGASGDVSVLEGTAGQNRPLAETNAYGTDVATLTVKANGYQNGSSYVEVGNLTLRSGNGGALAMPYAGPFYVHDIVVDDLSMYDAILEGPNLAMEGTGVVWLYAAHDGLVTDLSLSNGGDIVVGHALHFKGPNIKVRMADLADFEGAVNQGHYADYQTYEFVRVRNARPYAGDDGGLIHLYNSGQSVLRYISSVEATNASNIPFYHAGVRRTDCTNSAGPNSAYFVSMYSEGNSYDPWTPGRIGAHSGGGSNNADGCLINDYRAYNNVFETEAVGMHLNVSMPNGSVGCNMFDFEHNAYVDIGMQPITGGSCGFDAVAEPGRVELGNKAAADEDDHVPAAQSPFVDAGSSASFGTTPWLPVPEGGGDAVDIGAFEHGAGEWPYEFQAIAELEIDPELEDIRICWDLDVQDCDVLVPPWDPWVQEPAARPSAPTLFQVQIDPANDFASGNLTVAPGFGPLHDSTAVSSSAAYDVPAGTLDNDAAYYVQIRLAGQDATWAGPGLGNNGWGPWSVGFYRFVLGEPAAGTTGGSDGGDTGDTSDSGDSGDAGDGGESAGDGSGTSGDDGSHDEGPIDDTSGGSASDGSVGCGCRSGGGHGTAPLVVTVALVIGRRRRERVR